MLFTIFLLGLVYAVLIAVLIAAGAGAVTIAIVAAGLFAVQLFTSDKIALASMGARQVTPQEAPQLHAIVDRLCVQANIPKPRVAIAQTPMPNAFAVGRSPKTATVCATTGILQLLEPAELEAVLGHEITHVLNRDVVVMTIASFFASIAAFITQFGFLFGGGFGGNRNNNNNNNGFFVVILVSAAVYVISFLLLQALSRYREFAADRGSAILTGRPSALISALDEDRRRHGADPDARPARGLQRARRFLHLPAQGEARPDEPVLDPSAAGGEDRATAAARGPAPGHRLTRVGFLDVLMGRRKLAQPAPDRLFAMSTAYVTMETSMGLTSRGAAAIVFQPLATADFESIVREMEEVVRATASDSGTTVTSSDDTYGFRWLVLRGGDFDDLVVGINAVSTALEGGGYGDRVLCAVFGFNDARRGRPVYWIYNYKRGAFYPFAPAAGSEQRDNEREFVLKAQIGKDLPVEQELDRWFPLWGTPI